MARKRSKVPGLDYVAVSGAVDDVSFGVAQAADDAGDVMTAESFIGRRLFPVARPKDLSVIWPTPTCEMHEVILPDGASDDLWDPQQLARAYDRQCFSAIRDLAIIFTVRFPEVEQVPQLLKLHEAWDCARSFARERIAGDHSLAVVAVMHVPSRAARPGHPHLHLIAPARVLLPSGFGKFAKPLATDEGREILEREWAEWRQ